MKQLCSECGAERSGEPATCPRCGEGEGAIPLPGQVPEGDTGVPLPGPDEPAVLAGAPATGGDGFASAPTSDPPAADEPAQPLDSLFDDFDPLEEFAPISQAGGEAPGLLTGFDLTVPPLDPPEVPDLAPTGGPAPLDSEGSEDVFDLIDTSLRGESSVDAFDLVDPAPPAPSVEGAGGVDFGFVDPGPPEVAAPGVAAGAGGAPEPGVAGAQAPVMEAGAQAPPMVSPEVPPLFPSPEGPSVAAKLAGLASRRPRTRRRRFFFAVGGLIPVAGFLIYMAIFPDAYAPQVPAAVEAGAEPQAAPAAAKRADAPQAAPTREATEEAAAAAARAAEAEGGEGAAADPATAPTEDGDAVGAAVAGAEAAAGTGASAEVDAVAGAEGGEGAEEGPTAEEEAPPSLFARAAALEGEGKTTEALALYRQAAEAEEGPAGAAHHAASRLYLSSGNADRALFEAKRAVALDGDDLDFRLQLATAAVEAGRLRDAFAAYEAALEKHPGDPTALVALASLHSSGGAPWRAIELLEPHQGAAAPELLLALGEAYVAAGQWARAEEVLEEVADEAGADYPLALAYLEQGKLREARPLLEREVARAEVDPVAFRHLGYIYKELRMRGEAARSFRAYLERAADAPDAVEIRDEIRLLGG